MFVLRFQPLVWVLPVASTLLFLGCANGEELPASLMTASMSTTGGESGAGGSDSTGASGSDSSGSSGGSGSSTSTGSGGSNGGGGSNGTAGSSGAGGSGGKGGSANTGGSGGTSVAHDAGAGGTGSAGSNVSACSTDAGLPGGMMLLSEDFEDGTANGWNSLVPTDWSVVDDGSKVYKESISQGNSTVHLSAGGDVGWTNVVIEARVKPTFSGSSSSYFAGVCARLKDADNFYCAALRSDGKFGIRARIDSNGTNLSNAVNVTPTEIASGKWYTVKLKVQGGTMEASVVGPAGETATATATDCKIANGGVGLATAGAAAEFDDVKVTTP